MIPSVILWLCLLGLSLLLASALLLRSYARFAKRARGTPSHALPRTGAATPLDLLVDAACAGHPGLQGLANLIDPRDAFAARALSATEAGRSLDLIYYIWKTDTSGWLLMADVLRAADRGVRVRLLLDDVNVQGFDLAFLGLNQHPNIEVRLFNPLRNRGHWIRRSTEFALGLSRFNRRMHGKVWIADGRLAILGGRNIGDTYFGAPGSGARLSHDADMLLVGSKVAEAEAVFDTFWNLGLSLPILTLWPSFRLNDRRFRRRLGRHAAAPLAATFRMQAIRGRTPQDVLIGKLQWTKDVTLLSDPPDKALGRRRGPWLLDSIAELLRGVELRGSGRVASVGPSHHALGKQLLVQAGHLRKRALHELAAHPHPKAPADELDEQEAPGRVELVEGGTQLLALGFGLQAAQRQEPLLDPVRQALLAATRARRPHVRNRLGKVAHRLVALLEQPCVDARRLAGELAQPRRRHDLAWLAASQEPGGPGGVGGGGVGVVARERLHLVGGGGGGVEPLVERREVAHGVMRLPAQAGGRARRNITEPAPASSASTRKPIW